jgi:hypothetical protein
MLECVNARNPPVTRSELDSPRTDSNFWLDTITLFESGTHAQSGLYAQDCRGDALD